MTPTLPRPEDIDASAHLWGAFAHCETEVSAGWLVRFAQERGNGWEPFTYADINAFYERGGKLKGFTLNRLAEPGTAFYIKRGNVLEGGGWITKDGDTYSFTPDFIVRCHKSSPCRTEAGKQ